jgi:23S rRNA (pseudouridine1915-N3)-methyltransferase
MKIQLWSIGKATDKNLQAAVDDFSNRISKYYPLEWKLIAPPKQNLPEAGYKKTEAKNILALLQKEDYLVLLDERGKMMSSVALANFIQDRANQAAKRLVFLIGGAYGVDEAVRKRADFTWSFSALVFPHQLMRLMLAEQVYRACTIINNEKYHHL